MQGSANEGTKSLQIFMRPEDKKTAQGLLFERELESLVRADHPLVKLSKQLNWKRFEEKFGALYNAKQGAPGLPTRLMVGLTYLKYLNNLSDEATVEQWLESPYWQYFCGERYFQHEFPCDRSQLTRWRRRIGEAGAEEFLQESLAVAKDAKLLRVSHLKELYADTTVQEKHIAYPSESNLVYRLRKQFVTLAESLGIKLRQKYTRVGKLYKIKAHRYAAAQQWNRARKMLRKLRTILWRVIRDIERKATPEQKSCFSELLELANKLRASAEGGEPLYSLHEPDVEAIAKGKMHKRFEYGVKVSVVSTRKSGFVLGCKAMHGNPYDGHTLSEALADVQKRVGAKLFAKVGVDLGYRGHGVDKAQFRVLHPRLKKLSRKTRLFVRARSKIEATISLMKRCYRLGRNYLKGKMGDVVNALFAGAACNLSHVIRRAN